MKKIFLLFSTALLSLTASAGRYYDTEAEAGDFALGINLNNGLINPVLNWGLGAKMQFYATRAFRLEGSFNGFIKRRDISYWDANLNLHYVFYLKEGFSFYPILGATFMHGRYNDGFYSNREGCFGLNAGAGLQYDITENLYVMTEAVYKYSAERCLDDFDGSARNYYVGPRLNISIGIAYRF